jgi:N-acetylglutamate synthase-like GNAT family acetyltransferase
MKREKIKFDIVPIEKLKLNEYNPKEMTEKERKDLEMSIKRFGIVDPFIVNSAKNRYGIIIGGNQRYLICKDLGFKKVPVIWVNIPDVKKEKELCLRLSKNITSWSLDKLRLFEPKFLLDIGFTPIEIDKIYFDLKKLELKPIKLGKEKLEYSFGKITVYVRIGDYSAEIDEKLYQKLKAKIEALGGLENFLRFICSG